MSQNNNIGELITQVKSLIETLGKNSDQPMVDMDYVTWGKFISGLTQMQELSKGATLDSSEVFRGVNESLVSLMHTTSGDI